MTQTASATGTDSSDSRVGKQHVNPFINLCWQVRTKVQHQPPRGRICGGSMTAVLGGFIQT